MMIAGIRITLVGGLPIKTVFIVVQGNLFSWDSSTGEVVLIKRLNGMK